jgi:threonine/homoserine/homoserine lactone efflux protein
MISPMFGIENFGLFLTAGILLNLTPGQDTAYILGRSIAQGRRAGIASALGISVGGLCHTLAAALGLSTFLATSAWAFTSVKMIGAAYLVFLGLRALFKRASPLQLPAQLASLNTMVVFQGVITSVLNPKVALFFLAFLPQFVSPDTLSLVPAFLLLGCTFVATGTLWCGLRIPATVVLPRSLSLSADANHASITATGALFVFLGLRLATSR